MGRQKGKARKNRREPFTARIRHGGAHLSIDVTLETTVGEMKRKIEEACPDMPSSRLRLLVDGKLLDQDDHDLASCGVTEETFFLCGFPYVVKVEMPDHSVVELDSGSNDSLARLKYAIREKTGVAPASLNFVFNDTLLQRNDNLMAKGVTEGALIYCTEKSRRQRKEERRLCDVCGLRGRLDRPSFPVCDECSNRRYCSVDCQRVDWFERRHSQQCEWMRSGSDEDEAAAPAEEEKAASGARELVVAGDGLHADLDDVPDQS
mmetsp:Transcript_8320/g.24983  ORF Transcript_8320/g.24983 Transcript_8320/m.24983 type:complete len:263 (-) Transcript_8320:42-830(-)